MQRKTAAILLITCAVLVIAAFVEGAYRLAMAGERRAYVSESQVYSEGARDSLTDALDEVYHSSRLIARLPAVRAIDPAQNTSMNRGGSVLDENDRLVIQEIYNSLATVVSVSELYLVPITLDPDGTHKNRPREPWVTFDRLILGRTGGDGEQIEGHKELEEIEIFEYRLMREQLDRMLAHYPTIDSIRGLRYPMLAGPPVVTCDNSRFDPAHPDDNDRTGIVLSTPIYGPDGNLRGCVSAVMLNHAIRDLLGGPNFALVNEGDSIRIDGPGSFAGADRATLYHAELELPLPDGSGPWMLIARRPDADFWARAGVQTAQMTRLIGFTLCALLLAVSVTAVHLVTRAHSRLARARDELRAVNESLEEQVRERTKRLESLVLSDQLTGLPNRRCFEQHLRRTMMRARRSGEHYAVLFFDFDRFKVVNDSLGHDVGDALLISIADRFRAALRETDIAARFGGDEFVVLLTPLSDPGDAVRVAEKLLDIFAEPHEIGGHAIVSTASIGLVTSETAVGGVEEMIRDADSAMYRAKEAGKGRVVVFDREQHDRMLDRLRLEEDLRGAIDRGELLLEFQPIVDIESGRVVAAESLLRWNHPRRGLVRPDEFIPIAEESGLIRGVGLWAMETACRSLVRLSREGRLAPDFALTVNVSKRQLLDSKFRDNVLSILHTLGLDASRIWLEVTESTIVDNRCGIEEHLRAFRSAGMKILMDDFGTGHSSLAGLNKLPVDILKIDKAFLTWASRSKRMIAILQSIVALADNLGMRAIGEGVESADDVALLNALGCRFGQGFFYGRPCDADSLANMLASETGTARNAA